MRTEIQSTLSTRSGPLWQRTLKTEGVSHHGVSMETSSMLTLGREAVCRGLLTSQRGNAHASCSKISDTLVSMRVPPLLRVEWTFSLSASMRDESALSSRLPIRHHSDRPRDCSIDGSPPSTCPETDGKTKSEADPQSERRPAEENPLLFLLS